MCIRHETQEKARQSLTFSPVSKPHIHITYMLPQCTSIVEICMSDCMYFWTLLSGISRDIRL